jgi:hypothetical protein
MIALVALPLLALSPLSPPQGRMIAGFQDDTGHWQAPLAQNKTAVLFFVLAECPIARKYSQEMKRLAKDYPSVSFFAVHADPAATVAQAKAHRKEFGLPFPSLLDPQRRLIKTANVTAVPTAALFGADGRLKYSGRIDDRFPTLGVERPKPRRQDLRIALDEHLTGKPVSTPHTPVVGCTLPLL